LSTASLLVCMALLITLSSPPVSNRLVASLEERYEVLPVAPDDTALILVLADGHIWEDKRPLNSVLKAIGLSRITEGVRLWKTNPAAMLATSGAKFNSPVTQASVMNNYATEQGVNPALTIQFPEARDTQDEIVSAINLMQNNSDLQDKRLVVVSSAVHLARAEMMLKNQQILYTLAPTDFIALEAPWYRFNGYFLENANRTLHEYVGMLWLKTKGI